MHPGRLILRIYGDVHLFIGANWSITLLTHRQAIFRPHSDTPQHGPRELSPSERNPFPMATDFIPHQVTECIERITFGAEDIPAYLVRPDKAGSHPAALIQHGYGAEKADLLPLASLLASHGFVSLLPDAWGHGERFPASGPNWMNQLSADYFLTVLRHTAADLGEALTTLTELPDVRSDAMVIAGFSMGALAALIVGTEDERVAGVISASGSPLPDMLGVTIFGSTPPSAENIAWAEQHDAAAHVARLAPKPLLLQHGRSDDMVPIRGTLRMYETAKPYYTEQPNHLALQLYDHSHMVSEKQLRDAVEWLNPLFS